MIFFSFSLLTPAVVNHVRFEIYYWDYATGILIATTGLGLTLGNVQSAGQEHPRYFVDNFEHGSWQAMGYAVAAGVVFNAGPSVRCWSPPRLLVDRLPLPGFPVLCGGNIMPWTFSSQLSVGGKERGGCGIRRKVAATT